MRVLKLAITTLPLLASAEADAACSVHTDPVSFGAVDTSALTESTGRLHVNCDSSTVFSVGATGEVVDGQRVMRNVTGGLLMYHLYPNPSYTVPWGDNNSIGPSISASNDGSRTTVLTIYGLVPPQRGILPGSYMGSLAITLSF